MTEMLLGQSSSAVGSVGETMLAGQCGRWCGCTNWLETKRIVSELSCDGRLGAIRQPRRKGRLNGLAEWLAERFCRCFRRGVHDRRHQAGL